MVSKSPKHYARMIRDHVKALPDHYADDPNHVQTALGLTDEEFELGLTFCIAKKIIVMEKPQATKAAGEVVTKRPSPFEDESARQQKITTNEMSAVMSA